MDKAEDVIVSGSSAGGLAVMLHIDYLAQKIHKKNHGTNVAGVPDAGLFLDVDSVDGERKMKDQINFKDIWQFQGLKDAAVGSQARCYKEIGDNNAYKCMFPQYLLHFIRTPLFFSNSFADAWQFHNVMGLDCADSGCSKEKINYINDFRSHMVHTLRSEAPEGSGWWITDCFVHTMADHAKFFSEVTVQGVMVSSFIH